MKSPSAPEWLPVSKARGVDITPVAWFVYDFNALVAFYNARASLDREGGGAGLNHFFLLKMGHGRFAAFTSWERRAGYVELSLRVNSRGIVYWEDFEEVMEPLGVPLNEVRRQGAFNWHRRNKQQVTPAKSRANDG